ncbi:hypothetical protein [Streptomyces xinghaiensis]|uniref:DsbA family protein n=1 Tax=Streptomyces xinghaiensis TaxID=1038928 RepID=UPI002E12E23B|nr:DsbA family protein [Streptomyces xinghaiensis]
MEKFAAALDDERTTVRVQADQADGLALGVQGTPTFLIDPSSSTGRRWRPRSPTRRSPRCWTSGLRSEAPPDTALPARTAATKALPASCPPW